MSGKFLKVAVLYFGIGVGIGAFMGITKQFTFTSAHAHAYLLAWVSQALAGLIYKNYAQADNNKLLVVHFCEFNIGIPLMGIVLLFIGASNLQVGSLVAEVGTLFIAIGLISFVWNVFKNVA